MADGERLRQARRAKGWTQRETAAYAGLSPQFWNDVELGRRVAPDDTYAAMCAAVGLGSDRPAAEVGRLREQVAALETALRLHMAHFEWKCSAPVEEVVSELPDRWNYLMEQTERALGLSRQERWRLE